MRDLRYGMQGLIFITHLTSHIPCLSRVVF